MYFRPRYKPAVHHRQDFADRSVRRIKQLLIEGLTYQAIADTLNEEGLKTIRGKQWTNENVRQVICTLRKEKDSWYALAAQRANFKPETMTA